MIKKFIIFFAILTAMFHAPNLEAWGTKKFELSARAASLGGAFTARADDASAAYYNPAGLVFLEGVRIKTNILFNPLTTTAYIPYVDTEIKSSLLQFRSAFYLTWRLFPSLSLGLAGFNPYHATMDWPWSWPGRLLCLKSTLSSYFIRPVVSFKIMKGFSVGAGLDFVLTKVRLNHVFGYSYGPEGIYVMFLDDRHSLDGQGMGFVASFMLKISDKFQIGGRYQHHVHMDLKGEDWILTWRDQLFSGQDVSTRQKKELFQDDQFPINRVLDSTSRMTVPSEAVVGLMCEPFHRIRFQLDLERIGWGVVEDLKIQTDPGEIYNPIAEYRARMSWKDSWNIKCGLEYRLSDVFAVRTGFASLQSAMDGQMISPVNPDLDRNILTFGFGYEGPLFSIYDNEKISELSFDIFCQFVFSKEQQSAVPGFEFIYDSDHFVVGIGIGLNLVR